MSVNKIVLTFISLLIPVLAFGQEIHTVDRGETLYSISKQYNVSISSLQEWNELDSNSLTVGQELVIYRGEDNSTAQTPVQPENESQDNSYYIVKSGDTLYGIANEHEMSVAELKELNGIKSNSISVGQRLTVRAEESKPPVPSVATADSSSPQGKFISHKLNEKSSLNKILQEYQMAPEEFRALNPSAEDTLFTPGEEITLLVPPSRSYTNPYLLNSQLEDLGSISISMYDKDKAATPTTNGDLYNPDALTAAHSNISLGTVIFVENPKNKKGVFVYINDRTSNEGLKLSEAAWKILDFNSADPHARIYQNQ